MQKRWLIPRNVRDMDQNMAVQLARDLVDALFHACKESIDLRCKIMSNIDMRVESLEDTNGIDEVREIQLYAMLMGEEQGQKYRFFDIESDDGYPGALTFIEGLAEIMIPKQYAEYLVKNAELRNTIEGGPYGRRGGK